MLLSIITVTYNSAQTLQRCIESVLNQNFDDFEYLVVDGDSFDGSADIIRSYSDRLRYIIEPDNGLYDAMNKGLLHTSGKYVLFLNSDDRFSDDFVLKDIENRLVENPDILLGNVQFEKKYFFQRGFYKSSIFKPKLLKYGIMPPHPGSIIKRDLILKAGMFNTNFLIAADFDIFCKLYSKSKIIKTIYFSRVITIMSYGGVSTSGILSKIAINLETMKSLKNNGIPTSFLNIFIIKYLFKFFSR